MAKRRERLQTRIRGQGFRPVASPTDRFSRSNKGQGLAQLAGALSEIAPALERYALVADDIQDKKAAKEGEAERIEDVQAIIEAQATYQEAEDLGLIRNHQNPVKRAVYREGLGRFFAEQATDAFQQYKAENLSEALTLEEFDSGWNDFLGDWMEENIGEQTEEPAMITAFQETIQQRRLQERRNFSAQAEGRFESRSNEVFHQTIFSGASNLISEGASAQEVADFVSAELEVQQAVNGTSKGLRRRNNRTALEGYLAAASRAALTTDVPFDFIGALESIPTGTGTLGGASWATEIIERYQDEIYENISQRDQTTTRALMARANTIIQGAREQIWDNPDISLRAWREQINNLGMHRAQTEQALSSLNETRKDARASRDRPSNPIVRDRIALGIWAAPEEAQDHYSTIEASMRQEDLNLQDANFLRNLVLQASDLAPGGALEEIVDDETFKSGLREFRASFPTDRFGNMAPDMAVKRRRGVGDWNRAWTQWWENHPDERTDTRAKQEFVQDLSERILGKYKVSALDESIPSSDLTSWERGPIMQPTTYSNLRAWYFHGMPLESLTGDARDNILRLLSDQGFTDFNRNPAVRETVGLMLEAQEPFFITDSSNNDQR